MAIKIKEKFQSSEERKKLYDEIEKLLEINYKENHFWYWVIEKDLPSPCRWSKEDLKGLIEKLKNVSRETFRR